MNLDWNKIFIGDLDFSFALEIVIRTLIMFSMVLLVLRLSGKKGVRQLSLFEVAIIIALGSAAGDPMFNKDAPLLPSIIVFAAIIMLYRSITYFAIKSEKFENIIEGEPVYVIENGNFVLGVKKDHTFAKDEFFSEMRQESIEHIGQVKTAILETTGNISFYYYENDQVSYGLPILPKRYKEKINRIITEDIYACTYCAHTEALEPGEHTCTRCDHSEWVKAINTTRLT
nr:YetF domain-containing protein [uncultured Chryseobacterium sp.]